MITVLQQAGRESPKTLSPESLPEALNSKGMLWVDIHDPTDDDWSLVSRVFQFHPLALEDAKKQNQRPKVDQYEDYLFFSVKIWKGGEHPTDDIPEVTEELDLFLGKNYLVTVHVGVCRLVKDVMDRWQRRPQLINQGPAFLLYVIFDQVVDDFFPAMDLIDEEIDKYETAIYTTDAKVDFAPVLGLKKRLMLLRQIVAPMRDVVNHVLRSDQPLIPRELRIYYQDVYDHTLRLVEQVDLHRDILSGVMDALMAQVSNRLNNIMKKLTAISTILMSAALISGIYGMNFKYIPELELHYGYFGAIGLMIFVAAGLAIYFRKIQWI